jgi:hypothetical protein
MYGGTYHIQVADHDDSYPGVGVRVNVKGPLEERLQNDLAAEWWQGKQHP